MTLRTGDALRQAQGTPYYKPVIANRFSAVKQSHEQSELTIEE